MVLFRKINLLLSLLLSISFANAQTSGEVYKGVDNQLYYKYNSDIGGRGWLEVCAIPVPVGENPMYYSGKIVIPDEARIELSDGSLIFVPVRGICNKAFENSELTSISIPEEVEQIGNDAFKNSKISNNVNFVDIRHMLKIVYGNKDSNPMYFASSTTTNDYLEGDVVTIPEDIKEIKPFAFRGAKWLTGSITLDGVTTIGQYAFSGCVNLKSVTSAKSIEEIKNNAFDGCTLLSKLSFPSTLDIIGEYAFRATGLEYIEIPGSVSGISKNAFENCKKLTDLIILDQPSRTSRLTIGDKAFYGSGLKTIYSKVSEAPQATSTSFGSNTIELFYKEGGSDYNKDPWSSFNPVPIKTSTLAYYIDDKEDADYSEEVEAGTLITPRDRPNNEREFSGWKDEPKIMPNKDVVVKGSLQYQLTYIAGDTNDQLNEEDIFYFYGEKISDPIELKKDGLTYEITNPILTMPAKDDYKVRVEYSLNEDKKPTAKTGLKFSNADLVLVNHKSLNEGSGKITYSLDNETFSDKIPTGKDVDTYTVYYRVEGIGSTQDYCTKPGSFEVTIDPRNDKLSYTLSQKTFTYTGDKIEPDVIVKYGDIKLTKGVDYAVIYEDNKDVGTATVTIEDIEGGNYTVENILYFTITSKKPTNLDDLLNQPPTGVDNLSYDGSAHVLINEGEIDEEKTTGKLVYSLDNTNFSEDVTTITETNAGEEYTVYYKVVDDPNYDTSNIYGTIKVNISPKSLTSDEIEIILEENSYIYDGNKKEPKVVSVNYGDVSFTEDDYSVSYKDNTNVGTGETQPTVIITDKPGGNYEINGSTTFTILSADATNYTPPTARTVTYNGNEQVLINAGSSKEGTLEYSLDNETFYQDVNNIKKINAGEYTVYFIVRGDDNHSDSELGQITVRIAQKEITSFTLSQTSYTYDGDAKTPGVTVKFGETILTEDGDYTVSYTNNVNARTEESVPTVTLTYKPESNFNVHGSMKFTINKADGSLKQKPANIEGGLTYNGNAQELIAAGVSETGTVLYRLSTSEDYDESIPTGKDAGTYTVWYKVKGDENHKDVKESSLKVTINELPIEILPEDIVLCDGNDFDYTYDNGNKKEPDVVSVKSSDIVFTADDYDVRYENNINVGDEAKVILTDKVGGNYKVSGTKTFSILPAKGLLKDLLNQEPKRKEDVIYNGKTQDLITAGSTKKGTLKYSLDGTNFYADIKNIKRTDAGTYKVHYMVAGASNYTASDTSFVEVSIAPREITSFNLSQTSYTYDGTEKKPVVTVKYGETKLEEGVDYTVKYANNVNVRTEESIPTVTLEDKPDGNFNVHGSLPFTINKANGSLQKPANIEGGLTYNGNAQELITAGVSETGTVLYRLSTSEAYVMDTPTGTNAGTYTVWYKVKGDENHKDVNESSIEVTIKEKPITIESKDIVLEEDYDYVYNGSAKTPDVISVKWGDETFIKDTHFTVSYSNNTNVGEATVTLKDVKGNDCNYEIFGTKTFTILPERSKLTKLPTAKVISYNGSDQELINKDGTAEHGKMQYSLSQDESSFSETVPKGKDAGSYVVYCKVKGDANYSDSEISQVKVIIAPREITSFALSQSSYIYDGTEKKPVVTVTYNKTTIPVSDYSVSYTNNINAGTATVTLKDNAGGNFNVYGTKTFTINKADGTLKQKPSSVANLIYNGKAQNLINAGSSETGTVEYSLDKTNYVTTIPTGTDANSYTVYFRVKGDANHKDVNSESVNVMIDKAALTISGGYYEIYEGEAIPELTVSYDGFKNNETEAVLTTNPSVNCKATANSKSGEYTISVSGAKAANYNITHKNGKLVIMAMKFVSGGDTSKEEDDAATYQITSKGSDGTKTPTVAIADDKEVSGAFTIPESVIYYNRTYTVTEIAEGAFENNKNLTEVVIPSTISGIGEKAFKGCVNLQSITLFITTPINLYSVSTRSEGTRGDGSSIFDGVNKALCILYVPDESVELYKQALVWREFQHIVPLSTIPTGISGVTKAEDEPFDIYNLQGQKVKSKATSLEGLTRGIYIINGKKVAVK